MSKCDLEIVLEKSDRTFRAGERVRGRVRVTPQGDVECRGLKLTAGWRTHGRGNRDTAPAPFLATLFAGRWSAGLPQEYPFDFPAPPGPATYHGRFINVDHYIRVEADVPWAGDPHAETEILIPGGDAEPYDFGPKFTTEAGPASPHAVVEAKKKGAGARIVIPVVGLIVAAGLVFYGLWTFLLIVAAVTGIALFATAKRKVAESRLGTPLVRVQPSHARAGDTVTVLVSFEPRVDVGLAGVRVGLSGFERAVSGSGTNRRTHLHTLLSSERELTPGRQRLTAGHQVSFQETLTLSEDAAPTFMAEDNDVTWAIHVKIDIEGWPDWRREIPLPVRPRGGN